MSSDARFPDSSDISHEVIENNGREFVITYGNIGIDRYTEDDVLGVSDVEEGICYASTILTASSSHDLHYPETLQKKQVSVEGLDEIYVTRETDIEEMDRIEEGINAGEENINRILSGESKPVLVNNKEYL